MANTSATGGPLLPNPAPAPPLTSAALNAFFAGYIAGITGLPANSVRVAYQPEPPTVPLNNVAWCSFRVMPRRSPPFAYVRHIPDEPDENGSDEMQRDEELEINCSFYDTGTNGLADTYAALMRDAFAIAQNREALFLADMGFIDVGDMVAVPSLMKEKWKYRVDIMFSIRRRITRRYPVLNLKSAQVVLNANDDNTRVIQQTVNIEE